MTTVLLVHLRHGDSFNYIHAAVNRVRVNKPIKVETISKSIRKALLILTGPNPYKVETEAHHDEGDDESSSASNTQSSNVSDPHDDAQNCYYASKSFDGLREGPNIGRFYRSNVGWESHTLDTYLSQGTSWFDRAMQQSRIYLDDQVSRLNERPSQVRFKSFSSFKCLNTLLSVFLLNFLEDYVDFMEYLSPRDFTIVSD